jgi:small multidrug resistance pump
MSATYGWLMASTLVFMAANSALKVYAGGAAIWVLIGALVLFCVGNTLMVQVMRGEGLGVAIVLSSIFQMVAITLLAAVAFGERLAPLQWAGLALGIVAVAMIAWPKGAGA